MFQAGYAELNAQFRAAGAGRPIQGETSSRPILKSLTAVDRALLRAAAVEVNKLEKRVPFLATIASVAPFIGLFGTVGNPDHLPAHRRDRVDESRNSGPGIADALVATAAGLFAAIPAVMAYNHFATMKVKTSDLDDFSLEF